LPLIGCANGVHGNPDFCKLAESFGVPAWRPSEPEQVENVLGSALTQPGPSLVEIVTAADDVPPANLEASMWRISVAAPVLKINGFSRIAICFDLRNLRRHRTFRYPAAPLFGSPETASGDVGSPA